MYEFKLFIYRSRLKTEIPFGTYFTYVNRCYLTIILQQNKIKTIPSKKKFSSRTHTQVYLGFLFINLPP